MSRRSSTSPTGSPPRAGATSPTRANQHAPLVPSRLWQSHAPGTSPSTGSLPGTPPQPSNRAGNLGISTPTASLDYEADGVHPERPGAGAAAVRDPLDAEGSVDTRDTQEASGAARAKDTLLGYAQEHVCGDENCDHGTFSPKAATWGSGRASPDDRSSIRSREGFGGRWLGGLGDGVGGNRDNVHGLLGDAIADGVFGGGRRGRDDADGGKKSTTQWLARRHGIRGSRRMYLNYYFPFAKWITQYRCSYLKGDLIAAVTMASFYIPMALSYADNLGHLPPINGLYSFVFNPLIYAFLGTCPQMVVGPEAAGSLLVGNVVRTSIDKGHTGDENGMMNARVAGVVTGMAGAIIFAAGLTRLGFLDSVLSRPFLRGFISAIGIVIFADQLIPEMGLVKESKIAGVDHGSSVEKIVFLARNAGKAHALTCCISFGSFAIIMVCREFKKRWQPRYPFVAYVPDRFLIVVLSAVLTYAFRWDRKGLDILGEVRSSTGSPFPFHWPLVPSHMKHIREAMSTSFLIALLGFFESSVAAKSLGGGEKKSGNGIKGIALSANRELVALGVANIVGGLFMALPAFGGYGRSKVNASTGGKTPMSSIALSIITVICVLFILPWFYYLPKGVLSAMVSVVAYSLIEECPHDIRFFVKIRGYSELLLMALIFLATIFYSLPLGIALGMGLSLLRVIKHATQPRIQILGKVPGTGTSPGQSPEFENAEENPTALEFIEGVLIVKIPEPLTFANTGDLRNRLRRLEFYGTTAAHPALPRIRDEHHNANIVFDVHGVTTLDGAGSQVLAEIVDGYVERGVRVFFSRVPGRREGKEGRVMGLMEKAGIVDRVGGGGHFVKSVDEALRLAGKEEQRYRDEPGVGEDIPV